jgi:hypothetical protein
MGADDQASGVGRFSSADGLRAWQLGQNASLGGRVGEGQSGGVGFVGREAASLTYGLQARHGAWRHDDRLGESPARGGAAAQSH